MNNARILIVEDESIVALDMEARLTRLGYQVIGIAGSAEECIEIVRSERPDLALMDIRLQGPVDGIEAAQQLRDHFDIPVVYLTAYADEVTLQRAKLTEPFGYLIKPFEERELYSTIEMAFHKMTIERQEKAHAARLQRIIATMPEGVALLDSSCRVILANAKALALLDLLGHAGEGEVIGRLGEYPFADLISQPGNEVWHNIVSSGTPRQIFEVNVSRVSAESSAVYSDSSEWVLVIRDVTTEREIQEKVQLQGRLAAIGQFSAGIAHDFNNLLTSIIMEPYIINQIQPDLSAPIQERLETIVQQAKRASHLIQQILDFSRASAVDLHPFDLRPLLKELTRMLEHLLPENITLRLNAPPGEYVLNGDPTRILQVLMNLATNARDAMPDGGELCIEMSRVTSDNRGQIRVSDQRDWIRISVTDNGLGMQEDLIAHVFEPFFTTKAAGKGSGLGLAQVHGIVEQHGGFVTVESQLGSGSTFSVYYPAVDAQPAKVNAVVPDRIPITKPEGEQTILLVEDNPAAREAICDVLQLSGFQVITAGNGREALIELHRLENGVDVVLTDLVMPDMGGIDLCRAVHAEYPSMKIIVLTGYVADETLDELKMLGITDLLSKPVDIPTLLTVIESHLAQRSSLSD